MSLENLHRTDHQPQTNPLTGSLVKNHNILELQTQKKEEFNNSQLNVSGCPALTSTTALPSTLISKDRTVVSFTCSNECEALSHPRDIVCNYGNWTEEPPLCSDAG